MSEPITHEPQVLSFGGRGRQRGRPRVTPGDSSRVSVRIWSEHHDALIRKANEKRIPFPEYVRAILADAAKRRG